MKEGTSDRYLMPSSIRPSVFHQPIALASTASVFSRHIVLNAGNRLVAGLEGLAMRPRLR